MAKKCLIVLWVFQGEREAKRERDRERKEGGQREWRRDLLIEPQQPSLQLLVFFFSFSFFSFFFFSFLFFSFLFFSFLFFSFLFFFFLFFSFFFFFFLLSSISHSLSFTDERTSGNNPSFPISLSPFSHPPPLPLPPRTELFIPNNNHEDGFSFSLSSPPSFHSPFLLPFSLSLSLFSFLTLLPSFSPRR